MLNCTFFTPAAKPATLTSVYIHCFEELFLPIHALESDVGISCHSRVVHFILIALLKDSLRLPLQIFNLILNLLDLSSWLSLFPIGVCVGVCQLFQAFI